MSTTAHGQTKLVKINAVVVDDKGLPVAGVQVATQWNWQDGIGQPVEPITSDAKGRFQITCNIDARSPTVVSCYDLKNKRGGYLLATISDATKLLTIHLKPLKKLLININTAAKVDQYNVYTRSNENVILEMFYSQSSRMIVYLFAGTQKLHLSAIDHVNKAIDSWSEKLDVTLEPRLYKQLIGKPAPPLVFEDAKGVGKEFNLSDLKGKWVILDFWGWWCRPCTGRSIPNLIRLYDVISASKLPIEIIGIHETNASTVVEVESKIVQHKKDRWWGRDIPYPYLVDADGSIAKEYDVNAYPSLMLIDPDGVFKGLIHVNNLFDSVPGLASHADENYFRGVSIPFSSGECSARELLDMAIGYAGLDIEISETDNAILLAKRIEDCNPPTSLEISVCETLRGSNLGFEIKNGVIHVRRDLNATILLPESMALIQRSAKKINDPTPEAFVGTLAEFISHYCGRYDIFYVVRVPINRLKNIRINFKKGELLLPTLAKQIASKGIKLGIVDGMLEISQQS